MNLFERIVTDNKPTQCDKCSGRIYLVSNGRYHCKNCGNEMLDDYGKLKVFFETADSDNALFISQSTGVSLELVELYLLKKEVRFSSDGGYYFSCDKCGCSIKEGRYCSFCVKEITTGISDLLDKSKNYKSKREKLGYINPEMSGKMHSKGKK